MVSHRIARLMAILLVATSAACADEKPIPVVDAGPPPPPPPPPKRSQPDAPDVAWLVPDTSATSAPEAAPTPDEASDAGTARVKPAAFHHSPCAPTWFSDFETLSPKTPLPDTPKASSAPQTPESGQHALEPDASPSWSCASLHTGVLVDIKPDSVLWLERTPTHIRWVQNVPEGAHVRAELRTEHQKAWPSRAKVKRIHPERVAIELTLHEPLPADVVFALTGRVQLQNKSWAYHVPLRVFEGRTSKEPWKPAPRKRRKRRRRRRR